MKRSCGIGLVLLALLAGCAAEGPLPAAGPSYSVSAPSATPTETASPSPSIPGRVWTWDEDAPLPFDFTQEELDAAEAAVRRRLDAYIQEDFVLSFDLRELKASEYYTAQWFWPNYFSADSALYRDWSEEDARNTMIVLVTADVRYDGTLTPMCDGDGLVYGFTVHKDDAGEWTILDEFATNFSQADQTVPLCFSAGSGAVLTFPDDPRIGLEDTERADGSVGARLLLDGQPMGAGDPGYLSLQQAQTLVQGLLVE